MAGHKKKQTAGLRTYIITSVGAALTTLLSLYEHELLYGRWQAVSLLAELKFDAVRFPAAVVSGIGFLAAGSIILAAHGQVSGLTTAIGLFTSACMGIAAGAGFYEIVLPATVLLVITLEVLQPVEMEFKHRMRNLTMCVEYTSPADMEDIAAAIAREKAQIFEEEPARTDAGANPAVILTLKLSKENPSHSSMLSSLAQLPNVVSVQEILT